jgi:feruloyl esterase
LARGASSGLAGATPFTIATDQVALELQDPTIATPSFTNATGNGQDRWKSLSYAQLSNAFDRGIALQPSFANINTDNPDLSAFKSTGAKMIMYHGLADVLIPPQGSINYYNRVANQMGGIASIQGFYRFYLVPGMAHGLSNGATNANANPPLPTHDQLYKALTDWVEKGVAPTRIDISTTATTAFPTVKSRPICSYPQKAAYVSGDPNVSGSYTCS